MCGNDWINNKQITNDYLDIDEDLHYFEVKERNAYVQSLFTSKTRREHLLCEECEEQLQETPYLSNFKLPCTYQVYIDFYSEYPWACLVKTGSEIIWNQYNCIADQSLEEDGYDDDREYEFHHEEMYDY